MRVRLTILRLLVSGVFLLALLYVGGAAYNLAKMNTKVMILCSARQGGIFIPARVCKAWLFRFRPDRDDIALLQQGGGLDYVLNVDSPPGYELSQRLVSLGLDVNGVNHHANSGQTPLHAAVLYDDASRVEFLLRHGADRSLRNQDGLSALELARHLESVGETRAEIIDLLGRSYID